MKKDWKVKKGVPYPLGITRLDAGVNFAIEMPGGRDVELVLYEKGNHGKKTSIVLTDEYRYGNVLAIELPEFRYEKYEYNYRVDGKPYLDTMAVSICGKRKFGEFSKDRREKFCCAFWEEPFDWEGDKSPEYALSEVILYTMHVRGFTKHISSNVSQKARGTFLGIIEKIPYMTDLGINLIELMPVYEFAETIPTEELSGKYKIELQKPLTNYWGYGTCNYYKAVKKTYAASEDERSEFKELVKQLHRNGIEIILEFQFAKEMRVQDICDCLRYWALEYHVDGFHLTGDCGWMNELLKDPVLAACKLYGAYINERDIVGTNPQPKRSAVYAMDYLTSMRSFLKGDCGKLADVAYFMGRNGEKCGYVNYFTCHDGFTMCDMVSYDRKHNEANEEGNEDGWDYNFSWNCGTEGKTRKSRVLELRIRQMKNAWMMLLSGQGIPAFQAGDELCNSQNGNNNAYCQDNEVGWVNWKTLKCYENIRTFVRELIRIRRQYVVLPDKAEPVDGKNDRKACPAISYHSEKPWYMDYGIQNRYLGVMYCQSSAGRDDTYLYLCMNMDWQPVHVALPKLPKSFEWKLLATSGKMSDDAVVSDEELEVRPRTVDMYIGRKMRGKSGHERSTKRNR